VIAATAAVVGVGWGLDVSAVRSVIPGAVAMEAQTALGLGAGATAILLLGPEARGRRRRWGLALAIVPGLLGVAVLLEYILHRKLGIDEFPFVDHEARVAGMPYPGRFAPMVGACFLLLSGALLTLDQGTKWRWRLSELLAMPMVIAPVMSLVGYAYSIPAFYGPGSAAKLAVNTALCFLALAVALLLARPRGRVLELATTTSPAGVIVRRMVPLCVVVPLVLGWLHLRTVGWGLFNYPVGTWWMTAVAIAGLVVLIRWCSRTLSQNDGKRRALEARLYALANRDSLTGLFSRHRFEDELDQLLARARRYGDTACLLLFDLDHMKPVNDNFGHAAGDQLLREVADVVSGRLREADMVGRLGGDEFAALLLEASPSAAAEIARDLCAAIAEIQIETPDGSCSSTASIGVAPIDATPGVSSSELLARADAAMYRAKRAGGSQVALTEHVFSPADAPEPRSLVSSRP
jgi:diguanylate cyclase (GGDEF)-like protein